ncbi:MAG: DUF5301 domain-containing protein [Clostridia bacterium]|nr:DUF5301 domain-containing protein [Clostridia bacterium]
MEKQRKFFIILVIILFLLMIVGIFYHFMNKRTYKLNLPQLDNLKSISLEQNANGKVISDNGEMKDIISSLNGKERATKEESIQDHPVNTTNEVKVDFNFKETGASTLFIYEKNNKYYIEQPYNGIYRISEDEYNSIEKYIK